MEENNWYIMVGGRVVGPLNDDQMLAMASNNKISLRTMVKLNDSSEWATAADIDGLFSPLEVGAEVNNGGNNAGSHPYLGSVEKVATCPHCWEKFSNDRIHYISKHPDLIGDPILGDNAQQRFLPTKFNAKNHAFDARGAECHQMACPRCHLRIPDTIIDFDTVFFSIVGATGSGKSYFTTSMVWQLRHILVRKLDVNFADADGETNRVINKYEDLLFRNPEPDKSVFLAKTEEQGEDFYNMVTINGLTTTLPIPFVFKLEPTGNHFNLGSVSPCNMVFYDNAGEHYQLDKEDLRIQATAHLSHSSGIIFLFDPSIDGRWVARCDQNDPQTKMRNKILDQMTLLNEMISRIRRNTGMKTGEKYLKPLIVVVPKYDIWRHLYSAELENEPVLKLDPSNLCYNLDINLIFKNSYLLRMLLLKYSPEIVGTAENFSEQVFYVPNSAIGRPPELKNGAPSVRPQDLSPIWAEVPMLLMLSYHGYIRQVEVPPPGVQVTTVSQYIAAGNRITFSLPGKEREVLPINYTGKILYDDNLKMWFTIPAHQASQAQQVQSKGFWD